MCLGLEVEEIYDCIMQLSGVIVPRSKWKLSWNRYSDVKVECSFKLKLCVMSKYLSWFFVLYVLLSGICNTSLIYTLEMLLLFGLISVVCQLISADKSGSIWTVYCYYLKFIWSWWLLVIKYSRIVVDCGCLIGTWYEFNLGLLCSDKCFLCLYLW